jgi:hypothetical protein
MNISCNIYLFIYSKRPAGPTHCLARRCLASPVAGPDPVREYGLLKGLVRKSLDYDRVVPYRTIRSHGHILVTHIV